MIPISEASAQKKGKSDEGQKSVLPWSLICTVTSMFPIASRRSRPTNSSALKMKDRLTEMSVDGTALREISLPVVGAVRPIET